MIKVDVLYRKLIDKNGYAYWKYESFPADIVEVDAGILHLHKTRIDETGLERVASFSPGFWGYYVVIGSRDE